MTALEEWRKKMGRKNRQPKPEEPEAVVPLFTIMHSKRVMVPTENSQRRCYDGCFPSSDWEMIWAPWEVFEEGVPAARIDFWESLNIGAQNKSRYKLRGPS